jgi:hypothetical protein
MNDVNGYAVFFFPQALEALGEAIAPYLQDGAAGPHVVCNEIDTAGSLIEMTIRGTNTEGKVGVLELMVPGSMVRMIVSSQIDGSFGFGPRLPVEAVRALPVLGPTAEPATARPAALPRGGADAVPAEVVSAMAPAASTADESAKPAA